MDESAEPDRAMADVDRLEALEHQVRQLTSRLAGWVETQLVQALEDRRNDMKALRSELQAVVVEELAGVRDEQTSIVSTATRRLDAAQEHLVARVNTLAAEAADPARLAEVEERVATRLAELHDQVEARMSASSERQRAEIEALRGELRAGAGPGEGLRRPDGLEQRVRAAMSRLSESVESKLAEVGAARQGELDGLRAETTKALAVHAGELRTEIANTATALRARFTQAQERVEALERKYGEAEAHIDSMVEAKLTEVVDRRRIEFDQLKWEIQEDLAKQLNQARTEIGTTVSDAHRRFLLSVERLDERMVTVSEESAALGQRVEAVKEALASESQRVEALELHTRRTDERLTELVEGKLAELAGERIAELEEFRGQLRMALDNHLADTRVEVSMTTGAAREELGKTRAELAGARRELAEGSERLDERQAALDREMSQAVARLESLGLSVQDRLREAEARVAASVAQRLAELDPVATDVAEHRAEVAGLAAEFKVVAATAARAAFAEEGMLAPLRSDVRQLKEQVAELTELLYDLRPRRKAAAPAPTAAGPVLPAVRPTKKAAAKKAAPARKAAAKKKAAAPRKRTAQ